MIKRRLFLRLSLALVILVLAACLAREQLKRALIAVAIYRAHIMTPPPPRFSESWARYTGERIRFYWDFAGIPIARAKRLNQLNPTLKPLVREISRREALGENVQVPQHIYREISWRLNFTPDIERTRAKMEDLKRVLAAPLEHSLAEEQTADGGWAWGIDEWYLKTYYSVDKLQSCRYPPNISITYLDRVNSPNKMTAILKTDLYNRFIETRIFNREELDETFSALARMLFTGEPITCYQFDPQLRTALTSFVNMWQNPTTGYWGQWLVDRDGQVWKMDDMAITFHVVSDLHGQVARLDQIAKRTLALDGVNFPAGVRFNGHYENHLNWDVVKILRLAWPKLDQTTRAEARAEISRMLAWCLSHSYQPDGSFRISDLDDTSGDAYEYGVCFLVEAGYFDPKKRFWTTASFPDADRVYKQIGSKLKSLGLNDPKISGTYAVLEKGSTADP